MAGTRQGGIKAAATNKRLYGDDFYSIVGAAGGRKSTGGGFKKMQETDPQRLRELGRKGGSASRRAKREVGI